MEGEVRGADVRLAVLSYLPILFLIPLVLHRRSRFVDFHARQGLYLFSVFLAVLVPLLVLGALFFQVFENVVPYLLQNVTAVVLFLWVAAYVILSLLMVGSVLTKRMVMLPVLGELAGAA